MFAALPRHGAIFVYTLQGLENAFELYLRSDLSVTPSMSSLPGESRRVLRNGTGVHGSSLKRKEMCVFYMEREVPCKLEGVWESFMPNPRSLVG